MSDSSLSVDDEIKMPLTSLDVTEERIAKLRELFPEAFTEGRVDFRRLRESLGDAVDDGAERYGLSWAGRSEAVRAIQSLSTGTLVPAEDESINFDTTENLVIEGDNLEVLKLLQKSYHEKIKMIYIDPPYNTGNEFIYPDNFKEGLQDYLRYSGQIDDEGIKRTTNTETEGRYHSKWLSMMYPRMFLAKNLLRNDGVIFISIDDKELDNLTLLMNEIYGEENYLGTICWKNVTDNNPTLINKDNEFILCYGKDKTSLPQAWKSMFSEAKDLLQKEYERLKEIYLVPEKIQEGIRQFISDNTELVGSLSRYKFVDEQGVYTGSESVHNPRAGGYDFEVLHTITKRPMRKPANGYRFPENTFRRMDAEGQILYGEDENRIVKIKKYLQDFEDTLRSVIVMDGRLGSYDLKRVFETDKVIFSNPKPVDLLLSLISFVTTKDEEHIIADFFAGSATTAHAVLELNRRDGGDRRFILSQLPEPTPENSVAREMGYKNITEITRERIRRVISKQKDIDNDKLAFKEVTKPESGFRAFSLMSSNFRIWNADEAPKGAEELAAQLKLYAQHVNVERSQADILYELLLKAGFSLTARIEEVQIAGQPVYSIADGKLLICLADPIALETLRGMIERKPQRVICLDLAFRGNDQLKTNIVLEMKSHNVEFRTV